MIKPKSETANAAEYLKARIHNVTIAMGGAGIVIFAVIIAAQMIIAALGLALDHHCRSGGGKEHCVIAAGTGPTQAGGALNSVRGGHNDQLYHAPDGGADQHHQ
jgi:TPP-dependent pyruvate/acetoin dehydrogenase alpha subunit